MKTIAIVFFCLNIAGIIIEPFLFGEERKPYSPGSWAIRTVFYMPLLWLLWQVITK